MNATTLIVLTILIFFTSGIIFGWLIARYFYLQTSEEFEQASKELKNEAIKTRAYNTLTLKALEAAGSVELDRDDFGNVTGLKRIIKPLDSQMDNSPDDTPVEAFPSGQ